MALGRNLSSGSSFIGSMKNLSPAVYDVATTPSDIFTVKYCRGAAAGQVSALARLLLLEPGCAVQWLVC